MRVLLIEDDALVREVMTDALSLEGVEVDGLSNAEDALILLGSGQVPDVLVSDVNLGAGLSGFDLADIARERHPDVEVILMSGTPPHLAGFATRRHERFLQKPFPPDALVTAVREAGEEADRDAGR